MQKINIATVISKPLTEIYILCASRYKCEKFDILA